MRTPEQQLGLNVAQSRKMVGWSQEFLAEKADLSREYICQIEAGTRGPSLIGMAKIARALCVTVSDLCKGVCA